MTRQRALKVDSSAAVVLRSDQATRTAFVGAAVSTTQFDLDASASGRDDFYNGLMIDLVVGTGAGQTRLITDYAGATKRVTVSPALTLQPDTGTTYRIEPALPSAFSQLLIGGGTATTRISFREGGTAATDYFDIASGQYRAYDNSTVGQVVELLGGATAAAPASGDTVFLEWV